MRWAALSVGILALILVPTVLLLPESRCASDDNVNIRLAVNFTDKDSGHLHFYMGSGAEFNLSGAEKVPASIDPYVNDNMDRLLRALKQSGSGANQLVRSILNTAGTLNLSNTVLSNRAERNYFGLSLETDFNYSTEGIEAEYEYLDFIYEIDKMFKGGSGGLDGISSAIAKERELRRIKIIVDVDLQNGLSASTSRLVSKHLRTVSEETLYEDINGQEFLRSSNRIKVFDHFLLSPTFIFIDLMLFLVIGYGILAFVWWRERFKGIALVLPIITAIFPALPVWLFFYPGLSLYSLAGGTIWVLCGFFLLLVLACNLFNPKMNYREFEEESEEQPSIDLPEVIYINKRVYVDRPVRITDEDAMDPYEVLDVGRKASWEEIDKAYKSRVKEYHPDKYVQAPVRIHKAAKEETEKLNMAYEKLKRKFGR